MFKIVILQSCACYKRELTESVSIFMTVHSPVIVHSSLEGICQQHVMQRTDRTWLTRFCHVFQTRHDDKTLRIGENTVPKGFVRELLLL